MIKRFLAHLISHTIPDGISHLTARLHPVSILSFFFICTCIFLLRLPYAYVPVLNWDESIFFYIAHDWVHGGIPLITAWDTKGIFMYFFFTIPLHFFDFSIYTMRIYSTLYLMASLGVIYIISRHMVSRLYALLIILIVGITFSHPATGGLASNRELIMLLPMSLAFLMYIRAISYTDSRHIHARIYFVAHGILVGCIFFMLQVGILPFLALYIVDIQKRIRTLVPIAIGALTLTCGVLGYYAYHGGLDILCNTTIGTALGRASIRSVEAGLLDTYHLIVGFAKTNMLILLGYISLLLLSMRYTARSKYILAFTWGTVLLLISLRTNFEHYILFLIFPLALCTSVYWSQLPRKSMYRYMIWGFIICLSLALYIDIGTSTRTSLQQSQEKLSVQEQTLFDIAHYIERHSQPDEKIFILNTEPILYLLSKRHASTPYFFWMHHAVLFNRILGNQDKELARFKTHPPRFVVIGPIDINTDEYNARALTTFFKTNPAYTIVNTWSHPEGEDQAIYTLYRYEPKPEEQQ